jgi:hypothetical protein
MAPLPVIDGIHRVAFQWRIGAGGQTAVNVMHFHGASVDPGGLRTAIDTNVTATMWTGIVSTAAVYQLTITPLDGASATQLFSVSGTKWAGTITGSDFVPQAAAIVSLRTALRGRRNRGRIYLPFYSEQNIQNGTVFGTLTAVQAAWDAFRAAMKTASWPLHIASYGHSLHRTRSPGGGYVLTPVTWPPVSNEVISSSYELNLGTQRRRQSRLR